MSKASERIQAALTKHSLNAEACRVANQAKVDADAAFSHSRNEVDASIADVNAELDLLGKVQSQVPQPSNSSDPAQG